MDVILNRRSVRKYDLTRKISNETLEFLCRCAESAPSARRQKSREYVIINEQKIIDELSNVSKGSMILSECNTVIAVIAKNPSELTTPHMQVQDLSSATENILLAATSLGLGSCWIGITPHEDREIACNKILNICDGKKVFSLVALGYPLEPDKAFYDAKKEATITYNRG